MEGISFKAKLWRWDSEGASWYLVTMPKTKAAKIRKIAKGISGAWGTIRVEAKVGHSTWNTALFSQKKTQSYLLPIKAAVRKKENISVNKMISITLKFRDNHKSIYDSLE